MSDIVGAYMAYEDFKSDTIVDVSPFVPYNWYPLYGDKKPLLIDVEVFKAHKNEIIAVLRKMYSRIV